MNKRKLASTVLRGRSAVRYLLRDLFFTDRAAGTVNGTSAEPGPGTRVVADSGNKLSISGGKLVLTPLAVPDFDDPSFSMQAVARAAGRIVMVKSLGPNRQRLALLTTVNSQSTSKHRLETSATSKLQADGVDLTGVLAASVEMRLALVMRSVGCLYLAKGNLIGEWALVWVESANTEALLIPSVNLGIGSPVVYYSDLCAADLPSPWNDDYGIATQRLAGARAAADTFPHEADCLIELTATTFGTGSSFLRFRQQDATNCWILGVMNNGSMLLTERVNGVDTQRGAVDAGTVVNGHRIVVICDGTTIRVYSNNVLRISYASAANFQTATSALLSSIGAGAAISDIVSWPRRPSGAALAELIRYGG